MAAFPGGGVHRIEVGDEAVCFVAVEVDRFGPGQIGGPFVDLVERVGHQHQRRAAAVDHCLGDRKQCLAGAVDRQDMSGWIEALRRQREATFQPGGDGGCAAMPSLWWRGRPKDRADG